MVNGLVDPPALGDEPVVDAAQCRQYVPVNAGLLGDFADGSLLSSLTLLDMPLRQRPDHPPAAVKAADQCG